MNDITFKTQASLQQIIDTAIENHFIDPEELRMIVISPNASLDTLHVYHADTWDESYYQSSYDAAPIGSIDIFSWIEQAMDVLQHPDSIDTSYELKAAEIKNKYLRKRSIIDIDQIPDERYKNYIACHWEDTLDAIKDAIKNVAIQLEDTFDHTVGFILHNAVYKLQSNEDNHIIAFAHPKGQGPFYAVRLSKPNVTGSYSYLAFFDGGFTLFYPEGDMTDDDSDLSAAYDFYVDDIKHVFLPVAKGDSIKLRMKDEFADWELENGRVYKTDFNEEDFFNAFTNFIEAYPEKLPNINKVPHPLERPTEFKRWIDFLLENNYPLTANHYTQLIAYGDPAVEEALRVIPANYKDYHLIKKEWASHHLSLGNFREAANILESLQNISDHKKTHLLQCYYYLNDSAAFDSCFKSIQEERPQMEATALKFLYDVKIHSNDHNELLSLEKRIKEHIKKCRGLGSQYTLIALTRLLLTRKEEQSALEKFRSIDLGYTSAMQLAKVEFKEVGLIEQEIALFEERRKQRDSLEKWIDETAVVVPDTEPRNASRNNYHFRFEEYKTIQVENTLQWYAPIASDTFLQKNKDNLVALVRLSPTLTLDVLDSIQFDKEDNVHLTLENDRLYVSCYEKGIKAYTIIGDKITEAGTIGNVGTAWKYREIHVKGHMLYVENDDCLEIFDLKESTTIPLVSNFYTGTLYHLATEGNILLAYSRSMQIIDITDKKSPVYLSSIKNINGGENEQFIFTDNILVGSAVIDLHDPSHPKYLYAHDAKPAPFYNFSTVKENNVFASGSNFLLKKIDPENGDIMTWLACMDERGLHDSYMYGILGASISGTNLMIVGRNEIKIFLKTTNPHYGITYDIHDVLQSLVRDTFHQLATNHPEFLIGKVLVVPFNYHNNQDPNIYGFNIEFHYCSPPFITVPSDLDDRRQPVFASSIYLYQYFEQEHPGVNYLPGVTQLRYDLDAILSELREDPTFQQQAAEHVAFITSEKVVWQHYPGNLWRPFREQVTASEPTTVLEILKSNNRNLIDKLIDDLESDTNDQLLPALLDILSPSVSSQKKQVKPRLTNKMTSDNAILEKEEKTYITPAALTPATTSDDGEDEDEHRHQVKMVAIEVLCRHPNRDIVKRTILNGAKYSLPKPQVNDDMPVNIHPSYLDLFVSNHYNLFSEFSEDPDVKEFLMGIMDNEEETVTGADAVLASRYKQYNHIALHRYIEQLLESGGMDFYNYKGEGGYYPIDLSALPSAVFEPFEDLLMTISVAYSKSDNAMQSDIVAVTDILRKLGQREISQKLQDRIQRLKSMYEKYGDDMFEDEFESEDAFLLRMWREQLVETILRNLSKPEEGPLYDVSWKAEPYQQSWYKLFDALWEEGTKETPEFTQTFIKRLIHNIPLDDMYENDRLMAYHFVEYCYKHIVKKPFLASLSSEVIKTIQANKHLFADSVKLGNLKDKVKYTLLQDAWNDVKEKRYDTAEEKCEALISLDPALGQAYFLQARLLWLKDGIPAYLARQDEFIEKAAHDQVALARLYNLSGCALDVEQRWDEALPYFEKAALTIPDEPMYVANIAEIYYKLKRPKEAVNYALKTKAQKYESEMMKEILKNEGIIGK